MPNTEKPQQGAKSARANVRTFRQQRLLQLIKENPGLNDGELMLKAGYKPGYAKNPQTLKNTKSWQELIDKDIPEKVLTKKHKELLNAAKMNHYTFPVEMTDDQMQMVVRKIKGATFVTIQRGKVWARCYFTIPDTMAQDAALDKAYKIRGSYKSDKNADKANENMEKALDRLSSILPDAEL